MVPGSLHEIAITATYHQHSSNKPTCELGFVSAGKTYRKIHNFSFDKGLKIKLSALFYSTKYHSIYTFMSRRLLNPIRVKKSLFFIQIFGIWCLYQSVNLAFVVTKWYVCQGKLL